MEILTLQCIFTILYYLPLKKDVIPLKSVFYVYKSDHKIFKYLFNLHSFHFPSL